MRINLCRHAFPFALVALGQSCPLWAETISFPDFSDPSGLIVDRSAAVIDTRLRLVSERQQWGCATYQTLQPVSEGFSTSFDFQYHDISIPGTDAFGHPGLDGMLFYVQRDSSNFQGGVPSHGLTFYFDAWANVGSDDVSSSRIEVFEDGERVGQVNVEPFGILYRDEAVHHAKLDYDGSTVSIRLDGSLVATYATSAWFNLGQLAYGSFAAYNGDATAKQDVLNWSFAGYPQQAHWYPSAGGSWNQGANWTDGKVPSAVDAVGRLYDHITSASTIAIDSPVTLGELDFDSVQAYTVAGPGSLTLQKAGGNALINVIRGNHRVTAPLTLAGNTDVVVSASGDSLELGAVSANSAVVLTKHGLGTLTLAGPANYTGSTIVEAGLLKLGTALNSILEVKAGAVAEANADLSVNALVKVKAGATLTVNASQHTVAPQFDPASRVVINVNHAKLNIQEGTARGPMSQAAITDVWTLVRAGYNGTCGPWTGTGITSTAISNPSLNGLGLVLTGDIYSEPQTLIVREMILGDVNGDTKVTIGDVMVALNSANYQQDGTWLNGDVNYDGKVTIGDVMLMLNSTRYQQDYNPANAPAQIAALEAAGLGSFVESAVPEPATLGLLAVGAMGFLARRRLNGAALRTFS